MSKVRKEKVEETSQKEGGEVLEELETLRAESDERLKLAQYYKAEFENFKRRNQDSISKAYADGKEMAIMQILPIGDSLTEALRTASKDGANAGCGDREGLEILLRKFGQVLSGLGVEEIQAVGQPFDPTVHNAIATAQSETSSPDTVIEEFQKGYKMGGRLLRPSMVKVSK